MKLIKITTKHTEDEIHEIIKSNVVESDILENILPCIEFVEFLDESGFTSMFCIIDDYNNKRLIDVFVNLGIDFNFEDLTERVLFSESVKVDYSDEGINCSKALNTLIGKFYKNNIDINTILDKINSKGVYSLTAIDKVILDKF